MRRHDSLIPLTHDHHHALAQARRLRYAAESDDLRRGAQARTFIDFFDSETVSHFREEEEIIFPLVVDAPEALALLTQLLLEHVRLHALVQALRSEIDRGAPSAAAIRELATLLEQHIRTEEKGLFPLIERIVPPVRLDEIDVPRALGPRREPKPRQGAAQSQ